MTKLNNIIEFYGETCPHCISMKPVVKKIEEEKGVEINKLEVWNNEQNKAIMQKYDQIIGEACGGFAAVPAFVNTQTNQALCGAHEPEDIINLIGGGDCTGNTCKPHSKMAQQ